MDYIFLPTQLNINKFMYSFLQLQSPAALNYDMD